MKKSKKIFRAILVGCLVAVHLLSNVEWMAIESQASTIKEEAFTEDFNSIEVSSDWYAKNAETASDYYAMRFNGSYNWAGATVLNAYKLQDYNKFVFDVTISDYRSSSWIGFAFGGEKMTTSFGSYDGYVVMNGSTVSVVDLKNITASTSKNAQSSPGLLKKMSKGSTKIEIVFLKANKGYDVNLSFVFADSSTLTYSWNGINVTESNPYFAINSAYVLWDITEFKVLNQKEEVQFHDDFSKDTMTYSSENYEKGNWHINKSYTEEDVFVGPIAMAEFSKKDSRLTHKTPLLSSIDSEHVYDFSYVLKVEDLEKNSIFGMGFGMDSQKSKLDESSFCGIVKVDDEKGAFVLVKNGKIEKTVSYFVLDKLHIKDDKFVEVSVKINHDFSIDFSIENQKAKFTNIRYEGYWGIGNLDLGCEKSSRVFLDDISMNTYEVVCYDTPDASNNFTGTKSEETELGTYSEYYLNKMKWFMGPRVSQKMYIEGDTEPGIIFSRSSAYSYFGYREKYDEFVVQFDVVMNGLTENMLKENYTGKEFNGQKFGISFGNSSFFKSSDIATTVGVYYIGNSVDNVRSGIKGGNCTTDEGESEVAITGSDIHFWKDDETKYNFMYVVRDRTVEVYFKEDSQPMSELGVCRATFTDVDTDGYVMVFGAGNASFALSNYRIINIGKEAKGNSDFSIRENFSKESISDKLSLTGSACVQDERLVLKEQASISVKDSGECYLLDFDVSDIGGSFEVQLDSGKSVIFDKDNACIGFVENDKTTYVDIMDRRGISYNDYTTKIALKVLGNQVVVGVLCEGESYDFIYKPVATHQWQQNLEAMNPTIIAGEALTLDNLDVYKLDSDYEAERIDYDPKDENAFKWDIKEEVADEDNSNQAILSGVIIGLFVLVVVVSVLVVVILVVRKKRKRGGVNE